MTRLANLELSRESMSFSSGHFMIFSETEREHLHGHNYQLHVTLTFALSEDGINFNCQDYIQQFAVLCQQFDRKFLLPTQSRFLKVENLDSGVRVRYGQEEFQFLPEEIVLLPLSNISMEELSWWFLEEFTQRHAQQLEDHQMKKIVLKIYSAPGIGASTSRQLK